MLIAAAATAEAAIVAAVASITTDIRFYAEYTQRLQLRCTVLHAMCCATMATRAASSSYALQPDGRSLCSCGIWCYLGPGSGSNGESLSNVMKLDSVKSVAQQ